MYFQQTFKWTESKNAMWCIQQVKKGQMFWYFKRRFELFLLYIFTNYLLINTMLLS